MTTPFIVPPINTVGVINLAPPYTNEVSANVPYTVSAIRTLSDIAASGQDPYELYYKPVSISAADYASDLARGVVIISLKSPSGEWVYVPNSYLLTAPVGTGVPYTEMIVAVNLGPLPDSLSLAYFKSAVQELARDLMGKENAMVQSMVASETIYLTLEDSKTIEAARQAIMDEVITDRAKYLNEQKLRLQAVAKIAEYEAWMLAHPSP